MNLKFLHGDKSRISTDITPFDEGSFYVTHDGDMYVDMNTGIDNQRIQLTLDVNAFRSEIISAVYPVGSIYMSVSSIEPSTLFGIGTWEQIEGCFLLASSDEYIAGTTGGEATHILTIEEMPVHSHEQNVIAIDSSKTEYYNTDHNAYGKGYSAEQGIDTQQSGGGAPHNNMPPYLSIYVWKRIE